MTSLVSRNINVLFTVSFDFDDSQVDWSCMDFGNLDIRPRRHLLSSRLDDSVIGLDGCFITHLSAGRS